MFTRIEKPKADNKYYIRLENGGWSPAIKGRPTDSECNVLSNCVGYAIGRFNEILEGGEGCPYLKSATAKKLPMTNPNLEIGDTPKTGAIMVWKSMGTGHCAIVEKIINQNEVITSESFYGGRAFANVHRVREDGWGAKPYQEFMGFMYPPKEVILEDITGEATVLEASEINKGGDSYESGDQLSKYFGSRKPKNRIQTRQERSKRDLCFKDRFKKDR